MSLFSFPLHAAQIAVEWIFKNCQELRLRGVVMSLCLSSYLTLIFIETVELLLIYTGRKGQRSGRLSEEKRLLIFLRFLSGSWIELD